jgi:hypothetical protein
VVIGATAATVEAEAGAVGVTANAVNVASAPIAVKAVETDATKAAAMAVASALSAPTGRPAKKVPEPTTWMPIALKSAAAVRATVTTTGAKVVVRREAKVATAVAARSPSVSRVGRAR